MKRNLIVYKVDYKLKSDSWHQDREIDLLKLKE